MRPRPVGRRAVRSLAATLVLLAGCHHPPAKRDASYFTIRPVTRELPPPCVPPALAEAGNGQAVHCFEVGSAQVDAGDVASAALFADPVTGTEQVRFDLSPQGTERFNTMARTIGLGGQAAIVVDGVVASAPRLDTTNFPGSGVVTGLSTDQANRLVKRLNRS